MLKTLSAILIITNTVATVRGPHHPRGEAVIQHHVHYTISKMNQPKLTQDEQLLHDVTHLEEHLEEEIDEPDLTKMSEEELEFYYFRVHDTDNNSKLDGLEILEAIQHTMHVDEMEKDENESGSDLDYYTELIDQVLKEDDSDHDGYLSYLEYVAGRKKVVQKPNV